LKILYFIAAGVIIGLTSAIATSHLKEQPEFCTSCHMADGTKLHSSKFKTFTAEQPVVLAGTHRKRSNVQFSCITCHGGNGAAMKLKISVEEVKNTLQYFFVKFEEPKKFDETLMPDENCEACHQHYKGGESSFHGMKAHIPKVKYSCISCHKAHVEGDAGYYAIVEVEIITVCRKCHNQLPQTFRLKGKKFD
jgi:predicted CXXCH cytochrome family protein